MTITEFLEARIAEDEASARAAMQDEADDGVWTTGEHDGYGGDCTVEGIGIKIYDEGGHDLDQAKHIAGWDPRRVQAECALKRWLIGTYSGTREAYLMLRAMATVYADHPDYNSDWAL